MYRRMILRKLLRIKMFQEEPLAKNIRYIIAKTEWKRFCSMRVSCEHVELQRVITESVAKDSLITIEY